MSKRDTVDVFRRRLIELIARTGLSRSRFAARAGLDRSTLSQLLSEHTVRLPRAETIAALASRHNVSVDWLLGLSQKDKVAAEIVPQLEIETGAASPADKRLMRWREEAAGFKIRHVPTTIPDFLKTPAVIDYEYLRRPGPSTEERREDALSELAYSRRPETDIEVCSAHQVLEDFARGHGIWTRFAAADRTEQLERIARLLDELYPTFRWFLYDGLEHFSVPYTVFGPKRAAIYVGDMYFVFTSTAHIRELTRHFDALIRHARIQPHECAGYVRGLLDHVQ